MYLYNVFYCSMILSTVRRMSEAISSKNGESKLDLIVLMLVMAIYHPAFKLEYRRALESMLEGLKRTHSINPVEIQDMMDVDQRAVNADKISDEVIYILRCICV